MNRATVFLLTGLLTGLGGAAQAQTIGARSDLTDCTMARGASPKVTKVAELPPGLHEEVIKRTKGIVNAGEHLNTSDATIAGESRFRLIQAGRTGRYWYVIVERGIAPGAPIPAVRGAIFSLGTDASTGADTATSTVNLMGPTADAVCQGLDAALAVGATPANAKLPAGVVQTTDW